MRVDVEQADVGLVDQRRRLKGVLPTFAAHVTARDPPQLVVHQREQLVEGSFIAASPGLEQRRWAGRMFQNALILRRSVPPVAGRWRASGLDPAIMPTISGNADRRTQMSGRAQRAFVISAASLALTAPGVRRDRTEPHRSMGSSRSSRRNGCAGFPNQATQSRYFTGAEQDRLDRQFYPGDS